MTDVPRKPRPRTSRLAWAVAVALLVTAVAGGIWAYYTVGPGRTVDTSGIQPGMKASDVEQILGRPDDVVASGDEIAWRYGRTHIWFKGMPYIGNVVTGATNGPHAQASKTTEAPKKKGPPGSGGAPPGDKGKRNTVTEWPPPLDITK